jgi:hypothetical protein
VLSCVLTLLASPLASARSNHHASEPHASLVGRSKVWLPTDIPSKNLLTGPTGHGSFTPGATVTCTYMERKITGKSPKFFCTLPNGRQLKVKYGSDNGEVYGEVLASRLLWALGFGSDWMYSVRVICHECPDKYGAPMENGDRLVDPAAVERKMPGAALADRWDWKDLGDIDETAGGATRAERDAFALLAVLIYHGDSKPQQQRIICAQKITDGRCAEPLIMIQDLGNTFGSARTFSGPDRLSVNLSLWSKEPIWKNPSTCVANLHGVFSSTLHDPTISEEGRQLLAGLLLQLSDQQLRDMFTAARVTLRSRAPGDGGSGLASVDEWVAAFNRKRANIVDHRCPN